MSNRLSRSEVVELLPAFSLGILEPEEMLVVADWLNEDETLQTELEQYDAVVTRLGVLHQPAPAVRESLLVRINADVERRVIAQTQKQTIAKRSQPTLLEQIHTLFASRSAWATAFALLIAILAVGFGFNQQRQLAKIREENATLNVERDELSAEISTLETQVENLEITNADLQRQLEDNNHVLTLFANAQSVLPLAATEADPTVSGEFYRTADEIILVARNLDQPPPDQAYYLWGVVLEDNDEKIFTNLGLVAVAQDGSAIYTVPIPTGNSDYDVIDVSLEQFSETPPPILKGTILLRGLTP